MNEVEQIKDRLDIVEVVQGYIPLKKSGSNWKGLSPFKTEKTPSFMVSSEKNIWHDFSSGQGGDIFSFVMLMEGVDFREALEMMAKRAGVELKPRSQHDKHNNSQERSLLYDALEQAMKYYHLELSKNKTALEYLTQKRQLSTDIIKKFRLGYSPDSWDSLSEYLLNRGFTQEQLIDAGLARKKSGRNNVYDLFRDRIMFPVFDMQGRAVGFSARVLKDSDSAKYINTPETMIYHKSSAIYGIVQAKQAIRKLDEVIIVEGNVDVLSAHNAGFDNVVAASGTALTLEQLRILSRLTKTIKLCFDQDSAGGKATVKAIELARELDIRLMIMTLNNDKDPDEVIRRDPKQWQEIAKKALYAPDYIFDQANKQFDTNTALGKKQFAGYVLPVLSKMYDDIELAHYVKKLAQTLDVDEATIRKRILNQHEHKPVTVVAKEEFIKQSNSNKKPKRSLTKSEKIERIALELMLSNESARDALHDVEYEHLSKLHQPIFETLRDHPTTDVAKLAKLLPKYADYVKILSLRGEQVYADIMAHDARLEAYTQIHRLKRINRDKVKRQLTSAIAMAEEAHDQTKVKKLLQQYQALLNEE